MKIVISPTFRSAVDEVLRTVRSSKRVAQVECGKALVSTQGIRVRRVCRSHTEASTDHKYQCPEKFYHDQAPFLATVFFFPVEGAFIFRLFSTHHAHDT